MKHIILIIALAITMASCTEKRLIAEYSKAYTYKVYDDITYTFYFTNAFVVTDCGITFIDHEQCEITLAKGHYFYEKLPR